MSSTPTSLRLHASVKARLKARAQREGVSASALAERLIDEGLRMADHPGVRFRDGPAGRRAALVRGPDVAEVVAVLQHLEATGEKGIIETARWLEIPPGGDPSGSRLRRGSHGGDRRRAGGSSERGPRGPGASRASPTTVVVRLLLDGTFPPAVARALRERGYDVVAVLEVEELVAADDAVVFWWAQRE